MQMVSTKSHSLIELRGLSILFVEQDAELLSHVSHILAPVCRELYAAQNGEDALNLFKKKKPDLVVTDISLPVISGLELTGQIKQLRPSVPVIILSAANHSEHLMQAIDLQVDGYLTKPLIIEKLFYVLQRQASIINSRKIAEHESRLLSGVNMAIQYLLSADANQDAVDFALQEMAKAAQADKISLYRYDTLMGEREAFLVSGFVQGDMIWHFLDGVDTGTPEISYIERWYTILAQGKTLTGPRSSFPPHERHVLDAMRARSLLLTPIFAEGRLWGFACLCDTRRERHWSDAETSMVMTAARGLGSFMGRLKLEVEQHKARKELLLLNIQWRETFDTIPDLVMVLDPYQRMMRINKASRQRLDIDESCTGELMGYCYQHFHGLDHPPENCPFTALLSDRQPHETEVFMPRLNGYFHITVNPTFDAEGKLAGVVHVARDVTNRRAMEDRLRYLSTHDELTKLNNRNFFEAEVERLKRGRMAPLSVVIADLDGLKEVNDTFGHEYGDALIRAAADMLRDIFRTDDTIARIGGDEFAIILKEVGEELLDAIMERARKMLSDGVHQSEHGLKVRFSMGSATTLNPADLEKAIRDADMAMYSNKKERKKALQQTF
ncbi:MAG: diguanylate cyclase [Desulfuromonadales bacterium]|nr:diguanylate cyclase [Desulfuromonadales bacterium]